MAIKSDNFFNTVKQDVAANGTLFGRTLSKQERIEVHKTKDPIKFKSFVVKVLNKKSDSSIGIRGALSAGEPSLGDRMAAAFDSRLDDLLKSINDNVSGVLAVIETQTEVEEDAAAEEKQEAGKKKRSDRETERESKAKPNTKAIPSLLGSITKPMQNLWGNIVKWFETLLLGWGINTLLKWWGNPANKKNVEAFKEFMVNTLPAIVNGILALVAFDIGLKIMKLVGGLALGTLQLLGGLKSLLTATWGAIAANPYLATALGIAAIGAGAAYMGQRIQQNRQAADEQDDDSTLTVDEFRQQDDKSKVNVPRGQAYSETGTYPGMLNFNTGGFVSGQEGVDRVPAKLTAGEFVMSKGAVDKWGINTLEGMNAAGGGTNLPGLGGGGGGTNSLTEQAKVKTFGSAFGDFFSGDDGRSRRMTDLERSQRMSGGGLVQHFAGGGLVEGVSQGGLGMTQKSGYIGSDAKKNRFYGPDKEAYFLQVEKAKGLIEIWNEEFGSDKYIGTMDPNTKKIDFNKNWWGGARNNEVEWFNKNKSIVFQHAQRLIKMEASHGGISTKTADMLINNPPGSGNGTVNAVNAGGNGQSGGGGGSTEVPSEPMFSPVDKSNHYTLLVASMCNILGEN